MTRANKYSWDSIVLISLTCNQKNIFEIYSTILGTSNGLPVYKEKYFYVAAKSVMERSSAVSQLPLQADCLRAKHLLCTLVLLLIFKSLSSLEIKENTN